MTYLLDTNVFVNAKRSYYGFNLCPGFWAWLDGAHAGGTVASVAAVYDELIDFGDELSEWARARRSFFMPATSVELTSVAAVNRWANDSTAYDAAAKTEFASVADSFLIAHALAGGHTVVTLEVISDSRKRIKIPNAATALGVKWCDPFHMLRVEHATFVLDVAA